MVRAPSNRQLKAVFLLLLLAGHEAHRIAEQSSLAGANRKAFSKQAATSPVEDEWQQLNQKCRWSVSRGGCDGPGCEYRYLPLDTSFSESCRLSDKHMLETDSRAHFVKLQAGLLASKAKKYRLGRCGQTWWNPRCARRLRHMMRSLQFMTRAKADSKVPISDSDLAEEKALLDTALGDFAATAGSDGVLVLQLRQKLGSAGAQTELGKDPTHIIRVVALLTALFQGSDEEREAARQAIRNMAEDHEAVGGLVLPEEYDVAIANGQIEADEMIREAKESPQAEAKESPQAEAKESPQAEAQFEGDVFPTYAIGDEDDNEDKDEDHGHAKEHTSVAAQYLNNLVPDEDLQDLLNIDLEEIMADDKHSTSSDENASSMLQVSTEGKKLTIMAYVVMVSLIVASSMFLVVKIVALLTYWTLFSFIGCGTYAGVNNLVQKVRHRNEPNTGPRTIRLENPTKKARGIKVQKLLSLGQSGEVITIRRIKYGSWKGMDKLEVGDRILKVDGRRVGGKGLDKEYVRDKILFLRSKDAVFQVQPMQGMIGIGSVLTCTAKVFYLPIYAPYKTTKFVLKSVFKVLKGLFKMIRRLVRGH